MIHRQGGLKAMCALIEYENDALERGDFAEAAKLLPQKRDIARSIDEMAASAQEVDAEGNHLLKKLADLADANRRLLQQALAAQEALLTLLTAPPQPDQCSSYGPSGGYVVDHSQRAFGYIANG